MSCTPLPKAAKPVWANQLIQLSCLVVQVKVLFVYNTASKIGSQFFAGFHQFQRPTWTSFWEGIPWMSRGKQCLPLWRLSLDLVTYPWLDWDRLDFQRHFSKSIGNPALCVFNFQTFNVCEHTTKPEPRNYAAAPHQLNSTVRHRSCLQVVKGRHLMCAEYGSLCIKPLPPHTKLSATEQVRYPEFLTTHDLRCHKRQ